MMLKLLGKLSEKSQREKVGKKLAELLGAEDLLIFVKDAQLNILLPAPGFLQTLPDGIKWKSYLENCLKQKKLTGTLPFPEKSTLKKAKAILYKEELAIVLLGGNPREQDVAELVHALPLLASIFTYEQNEVQIKASLALTEKSLTDNKQIVNKLDNVRRELQTALLQTEKEIETRKKAEEEREEGEDKFRTLADNIPNLAWMANPDGYIFWYNSRWYGYTGTTPAQMEGWNWKSVHHPKALPHVVKRWKESIASGMPFEMVFPIKGKDKIFRPFLTRIIPVKDKKGKIVRWLGTNTDISKQKELERQKDEFLGIASHELKTPVTSIKAYGQVLQTMFHRKGDVKAVEHLQKMDTQVNKLTNLIGDLLDVTKIHSGRLQFHEEYFDFNELVGELVDELQLTTDKHQLIKELGKTKSIYADRERTGQVVTNLISNAIKYSPHTKKIIVNTAYEKNQIILCVQDFGVGIPKDKQDKVFEQFFRVSGATQSTFPGLGLGLYVSSEIIKRQGGRIWVESKRGKGSTFCISLPTKRENVKQQKNNLLEKEVEHE